MLFVYSGNEVWPSEGVCLPNVIKNAFNILTSIGFEFYLFNETRFRSYLGIFWGHLDSSKVGSSREKSKKKKIFFWNFFICFPGEKPTASCKKKKTKFLYCWKLGLHKHPELPDKRHEGFGKSSNQLFIANILASVAYPFMLRKNTYSILSNWRILKYSFDIVLKFFLCYFHL